MPPLFFFLSLSAGDPVKNGSRGRKRGEEARSTSSRFSFLSTGTRKKKRKKRILKGMVGVRVRQRITQSRWERGKRKKIRNWIFPRPISAFHSRFKQQKQQQQRSYTLLGCPVVLVASRETCIPHINFEWEDALCAPSRLLTGGGEPVIGRWRGDGRTIRAHVRVGSTAIDAIQSPHGGHLKRALLLLLLLLLGERLDRWGLSTAHNLLYG